jgi:hypothetical protein
LVKSQFEPPGRMAETTQSGRPSNNDGGRMVKPAPARSPSAAPAPVADFADLVDRALAILAEETEAWRARRLENGSTRSSR